jgi:hypothetical protein
MLSLCLADDFVIFTLADVEFGQGEVNDCTDRRIQTERPSFRAMYLWYNERQTWRNK